jgi:hypothetical protein
LSLSLSLLLLLQVFAVILSAAKDPEEANSPQPLEPFSSPFFRRRFCPHHHRQRRLIQRNEVYQN